MLNLPARRRQGLDSPQIPLPLGQARAALPPAGPCRLIASRDRLGWARRVGVIATFPPAFSAPPSGSLGPWAGVSGIILGTFCGFCTRTETSLPQESLKKKLSSRPLNTEAPPTLSTTDMEALVRQGAQSRGGAMGWGLLGQKVKAPVWLMQVVPMVVCVMLAESTSLQLLENK